MDDLSLIIKNFKMKRILLCTLGLATILAISCKKDINATQKPLVIGTTVDTLTRDITVATTVTRTTFIEGIVYVRPGVTLTINPGVTLIGKTTACGVAPDLVNLTNN